MSALSNLPLARPAAPRAEASASSSESENQSGRDSDLAELKDMMRTMGERLLVLEKRTDPAPKPTPAKGVDKTKDRTQLELALAAMASTAGATPKPRSKPRRDVAELLRKRLASSKAKPPSSARSFRVARPLSASSDSGSDSGTEDDGHRSRSSSKSHTLADERLAPTLTRRMLKNHASALAYVRALTFKRERNFHEARRVAQAIDAFRAEGVPDSAEGMEVLARTLHGLVMTDKYGDPTLLERFEWEPPEEVVPVSVLRVVMKDAQRQAKYKPKQDRQPQNPRAPNPRANNPQGAPAQKAGAPGRQ